MPKKYIFIILLMLFLALLQYSLSLYIFPTWKSVISIVYTLLLVVVLRISYKLPTQDLFVWLLVIIVPTVGYNIHKYWHKDNIEIHKKITDRIYVLSISPNFNIFHQSDYTLIQRDNFLSYTPIKKLPGDVIKTEKINDTVYKFFTISKHFFSQRLYYDTVIVSIKKLD